MTFYIQKGSGITILASLSLVSIVYLKFSGSYRFSLQKVIKSLFCCLFVWGGFAGGISADTIYHPTGQTPSDQPDHDDSVEGQQDYGIPLFRIDESRWFDITIDLPDHPETAQEVAEQRNRDAQLRKLGRPETSTVFPDAHEITEGIRLRFHYRFD
ncbi:hypothetical protein EZMO1_0403 [Endozoicomonas montiporae CL-33]|nr:hypothetical protein EZMO1_0403 [Endozoicomonas montiporae CL-33]